MAAAPAGPLSARSGAPPTPRSRPASGFSAAAAVALAPAPGPKDGVSGALLDLDLLSAAEEPGPGRPRPPRGRRQLALGGASGLRRLPELPVSVGPSPDRRTVSLLRYQDDKRDWRKLAAADVRRHFEQLRARGQAPSASDRVYEDGHRQGPEGPRHAEGLLAAVALGSLQACGEGSYWWPGFQEPGAALSENVRLPASRAFAQHPDVSKREPRAGAAGRISAPDDQTPLEAALELAAAHDGARVAVARFVAAGDPGACSPAPGLGDFRRAQLYTRTAFLQALHDLPRHVHSDPARLLASGAVLHTSDVAVLRGPLEDGAQWLSPDQSTCIDVLTVALPRTAHVDTQGQYARGEEKALAAQAVDAVLAVAVEVGVDAVVFTPLGAHAGAHPAEDAGDILHKAWNAFGKHFLEARVCQEYPGQLRGGWQSFKAAVEGGRDRIKHSPLVPLTASPYVRPGWKYSKTGGAVLRHAGMAMRDRLQQDTVALAKQKHELRRQHLVEVRASYSEDVADPQQELERHEAKLAALQFKVSYAREQLLEQEALVLEEMHAVDEAKSRVEASRKLQEPAVEPLAEEPSIMSSASSSTKKQLSEEARRRNWERDLAAMEAMEKQGPSTVQMYKAMLAHRGAPGGVGRTSSK